MERLNILALFTSVENETTQIHKKFLFQIATGRLFYLQF